MHRTAGHRTAGYRTAGMPAVGPIPSLTRGHGTRVFRGLSGRASGCLCGGPAHSALRSVGISEAVEDPLFEIVLAASAVCLSGGSVAYTLHVLRTNLFEQPSDAQIRHMIDTAPQEKFDTALAR